MTKKIAHKIEHAVGLSRMPARLFLRALAVGTIAWEKQGPRSPWQAYNTGNVGIPRGMEPQSVMSREVFFCPIIAWNAALQHLHKHWAPHFVWGWKKRRKGIVPNSLTCFKGFCKEPLGPRFPKTQWIEFAIFFKVNCMCINRKPKAKKHYSPIASPSRKKRNLLYIQICEFVWSERNWRIFFCLVWEEICLNFDIYNFLYL